jgi:hypothetical protein
LAKCKAYRGGSDISYHESISWNKDPETGHYWRVTQEYVTNERENTTKKHGKPVKSDYPYKVSDENDYDHVMEYTGWDNKPGKMYFKELIS